MPLQRHTVHDYEEFKSLIKKLDGNNEKVVLYFVGGKDQSGKSWCPDCEEAEPVVEEYIATKLKKDVTIVKIDLERTYFKDRNNPFRKCNRVRLVRVPTLMCWNDVKRLEESECRNIDLLSMFFEDFIEN